MSVRAPIQGLRLGRGIFKVGQITTASNLAVLFPIDDVTGAFGTTTETAVDVPITFDFMITRITGLVSVNSKNGATILGIRDDGVTVASVSVAAGATTDPDSGSLAVIVAAGSKVNFIRDSTASSSGSMTYVLTCEWVALS